MPTLKHSGFIKTAFDPRLGESLEDLQSQLNLLSSQVGVGAHATKAPPNVRSLTVAAANGHFDIQITDPQGQAQPSLGIHYFVEYDVSPAFTNPFVIFMGPARNQRISLGNATLYFRAYSQYRFSPRSSKIVYGGTSPIAVVGGGAAGPAFSASQGSGGKGGRGGFGG